MKIRLMGTKQECEIMAEFFRQNLVTDRAYSVSGLYPNRGNTNMYRLYVDIDVTPAVIDKTKIKGKK